MTSDRTTPPALPLPFFLCSSSSCSSRARLHDEPTHHTVWLWLWLCYRYEMQEAGKARHGVAPGRALPAQEALVPRQRGAAAAQEERDLHPVRRRQVVPMRGRARAVVHPRGVPRPAAADPDAVAAGALAAGLKRCR